MLFGEILRVSLAALRVNKLRSFLTMLGIVIGVSAVIAMVALGRGAQNSVKDRIASLGTTLLTIVPGQVFTGGIASSTDRARIAMEDADALTAAESPNIVGIEPEMGRQLQVQYLRKNTSTNIIGTTPNYLEIRKFAIDQGRMFTSADNDGRKRYAVLGPTVVRNLNVSDPAAIINAQVRIRGVEFTVIGVLASKGGASSFNDPDDQILIPINTARFRVFGTKYLRSISVQAQSEEGIPQTMADIEKALRRAHRIPSGRDDDFQIRNQADFLNTLGETTAVFGLLLAGIATVSLLVGGIGIMNIMLVSVTERTREIGIRKALGATKRNILLQFLIEAVVLCLLGGLVGVILGASAAVMLRTTMGWQTDVAISSVILAFMFSAAVGLIFGVWPARRASSMDPIVALRYE